MNAAVTFFDKDLSQLPIPTVRELLDYETLLAERCAELNALYPLVFAEGQPVLKAAELIQTETERYWKIPLNEGAGLYYLDLDSDPATRLLQADTYRELLLRNRVNQAALATMPMFAVGADLDHIGVRYGIHRLTVIPAANSLPAVMETDLAYRKRILLALEGFARGGSQGWYLFNAFNSSGLVKDAAVYSPSPCEIIITILSHEGNGSASVELLSIVQTHIESRHTRVLGDRITVRSAEIVPYTLTADIYFYPGPGTEAVLASINTAWLAYRSRSERIGHWITQSGLDAALHQMGVYRAVVNTPAALPLQIASHQAPYCTGFSVRALPL